MSGSDVPGDSCGISEPLGQLPLGHRQNISGQVITALGKIVFLIVFLTAIWSRWQIALHEWLWIDELHTSWVVSGKLQDVIPRAAAGNQSPSYFFLVFAVIQWFGQSPITLRLVSSISGLVILALVSHWVVRMTRSTWAATGALVFLGFDSTMVFCGTDARPYAILQLLAVACSIRLLRFLECTNRPWVAWDLVVLCGLMVAIHPVGMIFVLGVVLVTAMPLVRFPAIDGELVDKNRLAFKNKLLTPLAVVAAGIGALAINPALGRILDRRSQWANLSDWKQLLFDCACLILFAWIIPGILIGLSNRSYAQPDSSDQARQWIVLRQSNKLLLLLFAVPLTITLGLEFTGTLSLSLHRYLAPIWPLAGMAIGLGLGCAKASFRRPLIAFAVSLGALMGTTVYWDSSGVHFHPLKHWTFLSVANGIPSLMRSENWEYALTKIKVAGVQGPGRGPDVYLLPNLLEEHEWKSLSPGERYDLEEYLKFPFSGIYQLETVKVRPTLEAPHLLKADLDATKNNDCVIFVIRASPEDLQMITNELYDELASQHLIKEVVRHDVSESLHVVEFSIQSKW